MDRAPTPYPSGTPVVTTSQLSDETRAEAANEGPIDPFSAFNLLPLGDSEPLNVQVALARQAARGAVQHLTRAQAKLQAKSDDVQRLEQEARDAAGRHADELQLLTDELADVQSSYNAARFPVRGRSRIAPEEGEITPANGWETNDDRLPGFLIPGPDGDKVVRCTSKKITMRYCFAVKKGRNVAINCWALQFLGHCDVVCNYLPMTQPIGVV